MVTVVVMYHITYLEDILNIYNINRKLQIKNVAEYEELIA